MRRGLFGFIMLVLSFQALATTVNQRLYINAGSFTTVDSKTFAYRAFNTSPTFSQRNAVINVSLNDTLIYTIVNNDSALHSFEVDGWNLNHPSVVAGDSIVDTVVCNQLGAFLYYDDHGYPSNSYLGLSGILNVKNYTHAEFFWNIKEHRLSWNDSLVNNGTVSWSDYCPDYFTVNGVSNPNIDLDPTARVVGNTNDTIIINLANGARGIHSMHFHGYHCVILHDSRKPLNVGRDKDTFPVHPHASMRLQLIPDKPGIYPVHDHNLSATTGGGQYPNGMFTTLMISP